MTRKQITNKLSNILNDRFTLEEMVDVSELINALIKHDTEQLRLGVVVRQSEQLCQYDKMCVRKRLHLECPSDCKDDTRLLA